MLEFCIEHMALRFWFGSLKHAEQCILITIYAISSYTNLSLFLHISKIVAFEC